MFKAIVLFIVITFSLCSDYLENSQRVSIISLLSQSIHTLQKERGASAGYISSNSKIFQEQLIELKKNSDISNIKLEKLFISANMQNNLNAEYNTFKEVIHNVNILRSSVFKLNIEFEKLFTEYTNNISVLILLIISLSDEFTDKNMKFQFNNYSNLLSYKESVGQKRAILTVLFSKNNYVIDHLYQYYLSANMREKISLKHFLQNVDTETYNLYAIFSQKIFVKKVKELEQIAIIKFKNKEIIVDSEDWFSVSTQKINMIKRFEEQMFQTIQNYKQNILNLTQEELKWIDSHIVKVGIEDWSPIIFSTNQNSFDGIAGDFLKKIMSITNLKVKVKTGLWDDLLKSFKNGEIDLLPSTYLTENRKKFGLYGKGYFKMKDALFVKDNNTEILSFQDINIKHKKLAVLKGFATIEKIKAKFPNIVIVPTTDLDESIFKVLNDEVDALFDGEISIKTKIKQDLIIGLKAIPQNSFQAIDLHMFSNIKEPLLQSILDKALSSISQNERNNIISKWIESHNVQTIINIKTDESISFQGILTKNVMLLPFILFAILLFIIQSQFIQKYMLHINLKTFNMLIISFELIAMVILIFQITILDRIENKLSSAQITKFNILNAVNELKQSSDNLTYFARAYVTTGNIIFKEQYLDVLKIRNGQINRPKNYNNMYWHLSPEIRKQRYPKSDPKSLNEIFKDLPLLNYERQKLTEAKKNSDQLAHLELQAFKVAEVGNFTLATNMLHGQEYDSDKYKIMLSIDDFIFLVNHRTDLEIELINTKVQNEFYLIFLIGFIFIIANIVIFIMYRSKINIPVEYLISVMKQFQNGNKNILKKNFYNDEIGEMNREFFYMKDLLDLHTKDIEKFNQNIKDSIKFSSLIQYALLPENTILKKYTKDFFTFWKPRDVVGGDIYFVAELDNQYETIIMVIDGAGHGVPGAFVTMLVKAIETQIIADINIGKLEPSPAKILEYFNKHIKTMLKQEKGSKSKSNAGFDGGVLYFNRKTRIFKYSGAKTPLYIIRNNKLEVFKSDRKNIGFIRTKYNQEYTEFYMKLDEGVTNIYLATDGIIDQEGGSDSRFGKSKFEKHLLQHHKKPFSEQKRLLIESFEDFKSDLEQSDDVTAIGLQL